MGGGGGRGLLVGVVSKCIVGLFWGTNLDPVS